MQDELRSITEMAAPGELGNLTIAAEDARAELGWTRLEQTGQDFRYAIRTLRKSRGFTAAVVLSLAIGIGANTALFTLINTVLWKTLPVRDPETLLVLGQQGPAGVGNGFTYQTYELIRDRVSGLTVAGYSPVPLNVSIDGHIEPTRLGHLVTGGYFPLLGLRPAIGRLLGPEDDRVPMGHAVAVLSHEYWQRRFGGEAGVIGRSVSLSGTPFTIVGVAPPEFFGANVGSAPELFVPVQMQPAVMPMTANLIARDTNVGSNWMRILARVTSGVQAPQAMAQLDALARTPETDWRPRNKFTGEKEDLRLVMTSAATGLSDLRRQFSQPLFILLGVAGIVLLIACANVGNLVLARSATRRAEFALRLALGAGRGRLIRQVLVEGLVLAGLAGVAGVALAIWATHALVAYVSTGQGAIVLDLWPDLRVLVFTAGVSALAGVLFATVPALRASRADHPAEGRLDSARVRGVGGRVGPGKALVVLQMALSLVLLVGAGLFVRSLQNLNRHDTDVDQRNVLVVRVEPRGSGQRNIPGTAERLDVMYRDLLAQMERLPSVRSASLARSSPLGQTGYGYRLVPAAGGDAQMLTATIVYPRYFATMGIPVVQGRDFNDADLQPGAPAVVLVNEAFVRTFLDGQRYARRVARRQRGDRPRIPAWRADEHHRRRQGLAVPVAARGDGAPRVPDVPPGEYRIWRHDAARPPVGDQRTDRSSDTSRRAGGRQGRADVRRPLARRRGGRGARARATGRDALRHLRGRGARPDLRRALWPHGLQCRAPYRRNRRPRGAGRDARGRAAIDHGSSHSRAGHRPRHRRASRVDCGPVGDAAALVVAVRAHAGRSRRVRRRDRLARAGRPRGGPGARAARGQNRSHRRAPERVSGPARPRGHTAAVQGDRR